MAKSVGIWKLSKTASLTLASRQEQQCFWKSTKLDWQTLEIAGRRWVKVMWTFGLSVECGAERAAAEQLAQHLEGLSDRLYLII
ncbi:MAG: hypothetical protein Q6K92_09610 [Thermostichus sp. DG_1_5_bins_95]